LFFLLCSHLCTFLNIKFISNSSLHLKLQNAFFVKFKCTHTEVTFLPSRGMQFHLIWMEGVQLVRKVSKMPLNCFMRLMNVSGLDYGLAIASSTTILHGGLITV
jgi:hypothetical protein